MASKDLLKGMEESKVYHELDGTDPFLRDKNGQGVSFGAKSASIKQSKEDQPLDYSMQFNNTMTMYNEHPDYVDPDLEEAVCPRGCQLMDDGDEKKMEVLEEGTEFVCRQCGIEGTVGEDGFVAYRCDLKCKADYCDECCENQLLKGLNFFGKCTKCD